MASSDGRLGKGALRATLVLCLLAVGYAVAFHGGPPATHSATVDTKPPERDASPARVSRTPRGRAERAPGATAVPSPVERALRQTLSSAVRTLTSELQAALPEHPRAAQYEACLAAQGPPSDACVTVTADVINYAIYKTHAKARITTDQFGVSTAVSDPDRPLAAALLAEMAGGSDDALERISALMLLRYDPEFQHDVNAVALPDTVYAGLSDKPLPEAAFIAEWHRIEPLRGTAPREFEALAEKADTRARRTAFVALGHASTSEELHRAVVAAPLTSETWFDAAMAISACGLACADSVKHLFTTSSEDARIAFYEAVAFAPLEDIEEMVALARASAPPRLSERERRLRDDLLAEALSN